MATYTTQPIRGPNTPSPISISSPVPAPTKSGGVFNGGSTLIRAEKEEPSTTRVEQMQGDLGSRLGLLRENRQFLSDAAAQPFLQQISEQEGAARRQVGLEGSLGDRRRSDIANRANLARQTVQSQAFGQQIQSEQGLLQLQNDFSAMFNEMANTQFSQALSGLGEEIDRYMAEKGRDLKYADLATKAQATSTRMMGRLASGLASAFEDNDDSGLQR